MFLLPRLKQKRPLIGGLFAANLVTAYFFAAASFAAVSALPASLLAYLRRKRSTRPAVSTSFCLPVKKGWQFEQISTLMLPLCVECVVNVFPQAQCTRTSLYAG